MKNILDTKPTLQQHGRILYTLQFCESRHLKNKDVLDIGCGFGWFELHALSKGCTRVVGMETSEKDLATAKKHIHDRRSEFKVGSAVRLPFKDKSFDTVVCWEVLEHIPKGKEQEMFKEVHRVLKQGGGFLMSTPQSTFWNNLLDPAWWLIGHRHYHEKQLVTFGKKAGFVVERSTVRGRWWEIIAINTLYVSKWIFRREMFFQSFIQKKLDAEYRKEGFTNLFFAFRKV